MKRILNLALIVSFMACVFSSCKETFSSYSVVSYNTSGADTELVSLIETKCNNYNNTHKNSSSKEATLKAFDNLVKEIELEILRNNDNYKIYVYTEIKLSVLWSNETIKETKLNLQPNVKAIVYLEAQITQENISGDIEAFTNEYSKKLIETGFESKEPNKYYYYNEYETIELATEYLNNSILKQINAKNYFKSLNGNGFEYKGIVNIKYNLVDNTQAPKSQITSTTINGFVTKYHGNNEYGNGKINVSISK